MSNAHGPVNAHATVHKATVLLRRTRDCNLVRWSWPDFGLDIRASSWAIFLDGALGEYFLLG